MYVIILTCSQVKPSLEQNKNRYAQSTSASKRSLEIYLRIASTNNNKFVHSTPTNVITVFDRSFIETLPLATYWLGSKKLAK